MEIFIIFMGGLVLAALLFLSFGSFFGISPGIKNYALAKFREKRKENLKFYNELREFVNENEVGSQPAFIDSDITYSEILDVLNEKLTIVYSDTQVQKLLYGRLSKKQVADYVEAMSHQQEAIDELKEKLNCKKAVFEKRAIA